MPDWLNKILEFKASCQAGQVMTESQARLLRATLYQYESYRRNQDKPGSFNDPLAATASVRMIEQEIINKNETVEIDRATVKTIIDLLSDKLK